jgi:hypothetical protein
MLPPPVLRLRILPPPFQVQNGVAYHNIKMVPSAPFAAETSATTRVIEGEMRKEKERERKREKERKRELLTL